MSKSQRDIEGALLKKGFKKRDGDHSYYIYYGINGDKTGVFTKTSHGAKGRTISDDLFGRMARQLKLTNNEFDELVQCPLSREKYESILKEKDRL